VADVLYQLECITDNPLFEGFAFVRQESLRGKARLSWDFDPDDVKTKGRAWTVTPLAPLWSPQPVQGRVRSFNDYPCVNLTVPALSRRAVDALRDYLEANGELLPLVSTVGEYYAYNVRTVADILNHRKSVIEWPNKQHVTAMDIERFECFADRMATLSIFRIVETPASTYVTQSFVDRVHQHGLQGFNFIKLWPLPEGRTWQDEARANHKKNRRIDGKVRSAPVKGNSVVIMLAGAGAKPSKKEKQQLAELMNELDALLHDPKAKPDAPYWGSLEGDDHADGEYRLFVSCPNADRLFEKLQPWLADLDWEGCVRVLKRYGEYTDPTCREEMIAV